MKTFTRMAAQGDFIIIRVDSIPADVVPMAPRGNQVVVAHSETGHDHVMLADRVDAFVPAGIDAKDVFELYLSVKEPAEINHLRSFDTHETLLVPPGNYQVRRQREYVPQGFRRAAD